MASQGSTPTATQRSRTTAIVGTLADVIAFYETSLGFDFTPAEEADLIAFLSAL